MILPGEASQDQQVAKQENNRQEDQEHQEFIFDLLPHPHSGYPRQDEDNTREQENQEYSHTRDLKKSTGRTTGAHQIKLAVNL